MATETNAIAPPPDTDRLRRLAVRVRAVHAWLWDGGTQLHTMGDHRMECCDEDHNGCAQVGLVETARAVADSHDALLAALKDVLRASMRRCIASAEGNNHEWVAALKAHLDATERAYAVIQKAEG